MLSGWKRLAEGSEDARLDGLDGYVGWKRGHLIVLANRKLPRLTSVLSSIALEVQSDQHEFALPSTVTRIEEEYHYLLALRECTSSGSLRLIVQA